MSDETSFTALLMALRELDTANERTPCQTPDIDHLWTSDNHEEREAAAWRCQPCPVLDLCAAHAVAGDERWHVFGGVDRSPRPKKTKET